MTKNEALQALGGSVSSAAAAIGISPSAVSQWPEQLPKTAIDRVQAALWRRQQAQAKASEPADQTATPTAS